MSNIKIQDLPFMLGSDPELVIFDKKLDRIIPSNGLVKGTKDKPFRLTHGTVQLDGTATEIGPDAGRTASEFIKNIKSVVQEVRQMLDDIEPDRYELRCGQLVSYHPDDVKDICPTSFDVGCSAEYRISHCLSTSQCRLLEIRSSGKISSDAVPLGGHLHLGFCEGASITDSLHLYDCRTLTDYFQDCTRQLSRLNHERHRVRPTQNPVRIKTYGVEYRAPSSLWLADNELSKLMFDAYYASMKLTLKENRYFVTVYDKISYRVQFVASCIANQDSKYQGTLPLDF